jgi:hypothetical protein
MSRRLVFRRRAEIELAEAVDWYEAQRTGLGADFLLEFDAALARIIESPFLYQVIEDDIRRAPLHRSLRHHVCGVGERTLDLDLLSRKPRPATMAGFG